MCLTFGNAAEVVKFLVEGVNDDDKGEEDMKSNADCHDRLQLKTDPALEMASLRIYISARTHPVDRF